MGQSPWASEETRRGIYTLGDWKPLEKRGVVVVTMALERKNARSQDLDKGGVGRGGEERMGKAEGGTTRQEENFYCFARTLRSKEGETFPLRWGGNAGLAKGVQGKGAPGSNANQQAGGNAAAEKRQGPLLHLQNGTKKRQ